jgi:mersacidin/lichenicidin family type 2 lantibiotic
LCHFGAGSTDQQSKGETIMTVNIIRAWKDAAYFDALSDAEKAQVPANPAGNIDIDMSTVSGGGRAAAASDRLAASCTNKTSTCCHCTPSEEASPATLG